MGLICGFWSMRKDSCLGGLDIHRGTFLIGIGLMAWHICHFVAGIYSICSTATDPSLFYAHSLDSFHAPDQPPTHDLAKLIERANNLTRRHNELSERVRDDRIGALDELLTLQREMRELLNDIKAKKTQLARVDEGAAKWDRKFTVIGVLLTLISFLTTMFMSFGNYTNQPFFYKPFLFCEPFFVGLYFALPVLIATICGTVAFDKNELRKHTDMTEITMIVLGLVFAVIGGLRLYGFLVVRRSYKLLAEGIELTVRTDDPNGTPELSISRKSTNEKVQTQNE